MTFHSLSRGLAHREEERRNLIKSICIFIKTNMAKEMRILAGPQSLPSPHRTAVRHSRRKTENKCLRLQAYRSHKSSNTTGWNYIRAASGRVLCASVRKLWRWFTSRNLTWTDQYIIENNAKLARGYSAEVWSISKCSTTTHRDTVAVKCVSEKIITFLASREWISCTRLPVGLSQSAECSVLFYNKFIPTWWINIKNWWKLLHDASGKAAAAVARSLIQHITAAHCISERWDWSRQALLPLSSRETRTILLIANEIESEDWITNWKNSAVPN